MNKSNLKIALLLGGILAVCAGFVFCAAILYFVVNMNSSAGLPTGTQQKVIADLPADARQQIIDALSDDGYGTLRTVRNVRLRVTGRGQPLPMERQTGVDTVICYQVSYEFLAEQGGWAIVDETNIAMRIGNAWSTSIISRNTDWQEHSCPGQWPGRAPSDMRPLEPTRTSVPFATPNRSVATATPTRLVLPMATPDRRLAATPTIMVLPIPTPKP